MKKNIMKKISNHKIHFIPPTWNASFIVARTQCDKDWRDITEFSQDIKYVTCKKCIKQLNIKRI